ncbi:hypothetical protein UO65_5265 [Actinokineospora spheciospongiae]|uniref:Uncharacterized protein n=1 Tax=Actinokineospora spheciospongiae TaxID=909613 RepID=W7IS31_9PSEU|nr:hypothetical protein UO65_5265 [Actinokineospora spheciospongiae]
MPDGVYLPDPAACLRGSGGGWEPGACSAGCLRPGSAGKSAGAGRRVAGG